MRSWLAQLLPEPSPERPYVHPAHYRVDENVRIYSDGMHKGYNPNLFTLAVAVITLAVYISIPHVIMGLFVGAFFSRAAFWLLLGLLGTLLVPAKPLRVPAVLSSYMFLCWRRYFKFSYLFEVNLDSYGDYVIAQFPHGAFPLGAVLGGTFMASTFPAYPCYALAANAAFWVPIWRHVHGWLGTEACTKHNFHHLLSLGVKGPLPHRHSKGVGHGHCSQAQQEQQEQQGQQQEQESGSDCTAAAASGAAAAAPARRGRSKQQQQPVGGGGGLSKPTPFASLSLAKAAAADGVAAVGANNNAVAAERLGPFASAAIIKHTPSNQGAAGALPGAPGGSRDFRVVRQANSAPLGARFSAAFSLHSSLFRVGGGHTLSDSESSSESDGEGEGGRTDLDSWEACCGCGSGLRCRDTQRCAVMQRAASSSGIASSSSDDTPTGGRGYSSDGGSSQSSSCSGASACTCCGAVTVLAEVHSLPLDAFDRKQLLQQLPVPPSSDKLDLTAGEAAAVELDDGDDDSSGCAEPLLLRQQQQRRPPSSAGATQQLLKPAGAAAHPEQQQQDAQVQQPQQQPQQHSCGKGSWQVDSATGARKLGASVALMVGGIAEMFMIRRDHERIKLRDRKGFIRISLEHGVPILPVYMFGVNQALDFGPPWLQRLSRRMRASLGVIYGAWGLPIPRRVPIFMVTGSPIHTAPALRKDDPGFAARVDELHAQFVREVERLYYTHRTKYGHGFEKRPLVIC